MKKFFILITLLFCFKSIMAQHETAPNQFNTSNLTDLLPPSPNAASLGKFGGVNFGLSSGTMQTDIPLLTFSARNLKMPISLQYSSNGVRVDEIASRAGMSWALAAGGVITRTVFGEIDERSQRIIPPGDFPQRNRGLIDFTNQLISSDGAPKGVDGEPDLFSFNFNGYSGKFILDAQLNPILLNPSALKIVRNEDTFIITAPDGVIYSFGGLAANEVTTNDVVGQGCGKIFNNPAITAFYLTKVQHPNGENFTLSYSSTNYEYKTGVSGSLYKRNTNQTPASCRFGRDAPINIPPRTMCISRLSLHAVLLKQILSSDGSKLVFSYIDRKDLDDQLLNSVDLYAPLASSWIKRFELNYDQVKSVDRINFEPGLSSDSTLYYRPFLINVREKASNNSIKQEYKLAYYDTGSLPARLSYGQDHYGFFNGKNDNQSFFTKSIFKNRQQFFPEATANREPDDNFTKAGMLSKITYPTGGTDEIIYENNLYYTSVKKDGTVVTEDITARGSGSTDIGYATSAPIFIEEGQQVILYGACDYSPENGEEGDEIHYFGDISLFNVTQNAIVATMRVAPGQPKNVVCELIQGETYRINATASRGKMVRAGGTVSYTKGPAEYEYINKPIAGIRVKKIITNDGITNNTKKYTYAKIETPGISSAGLAFQPIYEEYVKIYANCLNGTDPKTAASQIDCGVQQLDFYCIHSSNLGNAYAYTGAPVYYSDVIEEWDNNKDNGGTAYKYIVENDVHGNPILGEPITNAPLTSKNYINGKEISQTIFKRTDLTIKPIKKTETHYTVDPRINTQYKAYIARKKYLTQCTYDIPDLVELNSYDLMTYAYYQKWLYADSIKTSLYDDAGNIYANTIQVMAYNNDLHKQVTAIKTNTSQGTVTLKSFAYPNEMINNSKDPSGVYTKMVNKNIVSPLIEEKTSQNGFTQTTLTNFKDWYNDGNTIVKESISTQTDTYPQETRARYQEYNKQGNPLSVSKEGGVKNCYIWSYYNQNPIAEIKNAEYSIIQEVLGGAGAVNEFANRPSPTIAEVNMFLSPLRTDPRLNSAQITTIKYEPLVGMKEITDSKGKTIYYEYDEFQRLKFVKNQKGNIVSAQSYHFRP